MLALLTGMIIRRLCVGKRYAYGIEDVNPELRPFTDVWALHVGVVIVAGAAAGGLLAIVNDAGGAAPCCAIGGASCSLVFVPVCLAVVAAARRAQRARLGSLVASCDRRAVQGILAITLAVTTLEAVPDWPAAVMGIRALPLVAVAMLVAAAAMTIGILLLDRRTLQQARRVTAVGLLERPFDEIESSDPSIVRLDFGLGDQLGAQAVRGGAAYRQRERTVALVLGSPELTLEALRRAVRRSVVGLVVIGGVAATHAVAATSSSACALYEAHVDTWNKGACPASAR